MSIWGKDRLALVGSVLYGKLFGPLLFLSGHQPLYLQTLLPFDSNARARVVTRESARCCVCVFPLRRNEYRCSRYQLIH